MRIFDAAVNDVVFAENLDVFAVAGDCWTGHTITKTVPVDAQGEIELKFVSSQAEAMISFIHIVPVPGATTDSPTAAPTTSPAPTSSPTEKCWSTYTCPENAVPNEICQWGLWNCDCEDGFEKDWDNDLCIPSDPQQNQCGSTFTCPENSVAKAESNGCVWSIWDCVCDEGFVPDGDSNTCIEEEFVCWSSYTCPDNSVSTDVNGCSWGLWDCECDVGFNKDWDNNACLDPNAGTPTQAPTPAPTEAPTKAPLSQQEIEQALSDCRDDIEAILTVDLIAKFVRLSFHDCVGGICDGCVDTSNPANFGLDVPIDALAPIAEKYAGILTRGDVWMWAAMVAIEVSQSTPIVPFNMMWVGRPECDGPANRGPDRTLPSSHFFTQQLLDFFNAEFGFTDRDTVAIIGAHTLGRALPQNSGYNGQAGWVGARDTFNNGFYRALLDSNGIDDIFRLEEQDNSARPEFPNQFLWRRGTRSSRFMLNVDMALAVDFEGSIDPVSGDVSCNLSGSSNVCKDASTVDIALEYAASNSAWVNDFHTAFMKMTSVGCDLGLCFELCRNHQRICVQLQKLCRTMQLKPRHKQKYSSRSVLT